MIMMMNSNKRRIEIGYGIFYGKNNQRYRVLSFSVVYHICLSPTKVAISDFLMVFEEGVGTGFYVVGNMFPILLTC